MFFRLHIALVVIFLASNAIALMDERIPDDQIRFAAARCVSSILAVTEPPYDTENQKEQLNDWTEGSCLGLFYYYQSVAALMITSNAKDRAKAREILRGYMDPEINRWLQARANASEYFAWNIFLRIPVFYSKTVRDLISSYPVSHQDSDRLFAETCCRLSKDIMHHIEQGLNFSDLVSQDNLGFFTSGEAEDAQYMHAVNDLKEENPWIEYNTELWNWHADHGVAVGTHERISAAGVRDVLMLTYKAADSL